MKKKKNLKKQIYQRHHIQYDPEVVVKIRRKVHWLITMMNRYKDFTYNEKRAMRYILKHKPLCRKQKEVFAYITATLQVGVWSMIPLVPLKRQVKPVVATPITAIFMVMQKARNARKDP